MRQIRFRALAVVNDKHNFIKIGDFVYGAYIESGVDAPCIIFGDGEQIEIDRKTLGQLTGSTDNNGVEIYGGDILKDHVGIGEVKYSDRHAAFRVIYVDGMAKWFYDYNLKGERESIEVIGTTHKNPELLEQQS
jgi:uncharacterized phage protein (TIGR01671 family)